MLNQFFIWRELGSLAVARYAHLFGYLFTYLSYYCTRGPYPGIFYGFLFLAFIIYVIIIVINTIIIIVILLLLLLFLFLLLLLLFLCYLSLFLHRASSSFCSATATNFIASWFLFFEFICNYMGIMIFLTYSIIYIGTLFSIYLLNCISFVLLKIN